MNHPIPYGKQHITEADIAAVSTALRGELLTQGPTIAAFEQDFAAYIGCRYAVAVSNGTAALHLSALALGCEGKKVLVTPLTFAASINCVLYAGGIPDFVDIDPRTLLMDVELVRQKLESAPEGTYAGIIPVDFAGCPVDLAPLRELADLHGLWILEDACHAPGGFVVRPDGSHARCGDGSAAELAIFSLHPVKHIAAGEGGVITTNNAALYEKLLRLRNHGMERDPARWQLSPDDLAQGGWYYEIQTLGFNYRLPDILAALAQSQLRRADEGLARRRALAERYRQAFVGTQVHHSQPFDGHAWHLFVVEVENRKAVYDALRNHKIFTQIHYIPAHLLPIYQQQGWQKGDCPHAEAYYERCLSLPMYPTLTDEEQNFVISTLLNILQDR